MRYLEYKVYFVGNINFLFMEYGLPDDRKVGSSIPTQDDCTQMWYHSDKDMVT